MRMPFHVHAPVRAARNWAPRQAAHCSSCAMRHLCVPQGLAPDVLARLETIIHAARALKRGDALFREGDAFGNLFAVRSGSLKTVAVRDDGRAQVTGLHLAGEALGLDAISGDAYPCTAVALEDSSVCVIPYASLSRLCMEADPMQLRLHKLMSAQILRETSKTMLLGALNAEERVAAFLLEVSARYQKRGYSAAEFNMRMTREDTGSFLGMTLETVSRTLSKFQRLGLIEMRGRVVCIVDFDGLRNI